MKYIRPCAGRILAVLLVSMASAPLALLAPLPLKIVVDNALSQRPLPLWIDHLMPPGVPRSPAAFLILAAVLVVAIALLTQAQALANVVLSTSTSQRLVLQFRTALFRHSQRLSLAYHETHGTSHTTYRIGYDAPSIQFVLVDGLIPFVSAVVSLFAIAYVTLHLDWQLALIALAVSPLLFLISHRYRGQMRARHHKAKELESRALSVVHEVLGALRVVKAFGQESREEGRFSERAGEWARVQQQNAVAEGVFGLLIGTTTALGTAFTLLIGAEHVRNGTLTLGALLLIMSYLLQLYGPLTTISRKAASIQAHLASLDRAFSFLDLPPDVPERPEARALVRARGAIAFRNVSYAYSTAPTLHAVSFEIPPGTRLGISGRTGGGKTTLVNLLMRFFDPSEGQILLDGVDVRDYRLADLRAQFALVLQEPVLFRTSVRENIAYARPDASEAEIVAAAKAANAHEFILRLPHGYDTLVGERGMQVSGGERQRISLARAFLKDAPILVLDEPTSSVDTVTEAAIIEATQRLMEGRTTLMIAHRLSTLEHCDARLSVEQGRVWMTEGPAGDAAAAPTQPVGVGGV
jgi:ATP-binding cassette subfamily B protein